MIGSIAVTRPLAGRLHHDFAVASRLWMYGSRLETTITSVSGNFCASTRCSMAGDQSTSGPSAGSPVSLRSRNRCRNSPANGVSFGRGDRAAAAEPDVVDSAPQRLHPTARQ